MKNLGLGCLLIFLLGCSRSDMLSDNIPSSPHAYKIIHDLSYNDLVSQIGQAKLSQAVEQPGLDGSLGRNKHGYFHVRFQLNMTSISDLAVVGQRMDALQALVATINYAFSHQLQDGSFAFFPPDELVNSPSYSPPTPGDLASGNAFFMSSLGLSLLTLQDSKWFLESEATQEIRNELELLSPAFELALDDLINKQEVLKLYDSQAPNRLLFDALAFYSLGKYLSRTDAQLIAFEFIDSALSLTDSEGYFVEGGGWDSSYNGVAIKLAMELYSILEDTALKNRLAVAIEKATTWQISRIRENGEISTEGNTRVFKGGESFLGVEKGVDYAKTVKALYYFGYLTDAPEVVDLGNKVLDFYR